MRGPLESRLIVAVGLVAAGIGAACAEDPGTRGVYIIEAPQSPADSTVLATPQASPAPPQSTPPVAVPGSQSPPILPPAAAALPLDTEVPAALAPPRPAPTPTATASAPLLHPTPPMAGPGSQPPILPPAAAALPLDTEVPAALAPARPAPTPAATASAPLPRPGFELSGHSVELAAPRARPDAALATPSPLKLDVENSAELSLELVPGPEVTVGTKMAFRVRAKKSGYLVLVDIDPNGKLTQIYPNPQTLAGAGARAKSNFIKAGRTVVVPDLMSGTEYVATPPIGMATIVAVLSDRPVQMLDLAEIPSFVADQAAEVAYLSRMTSELRILSDGAPQQARWSFDAKAYAIRGLP